MNLLRTAPRRKTFAWIIGVCASLALSFYASLSAIDQYTYHTVAGWFWGSGPPIYDLEIVLWPMHYRYPPLFVFLYTPLMVLPFRAAVVVWTLGKCGVLAWLATRLSQRAGGLGPVAWCVVACIAVPYVVMEFRYANVQFFVFGLVAAALLFPRRTFTASGLLGLAIAIKVWPLFFVPLLAAQARWKLAAGSVLVALVLTASPALYLGWEGNMQLLGQWYEQEFNTASRLDTLWFPSQSLGGVMARYLIDIDYEALPDSNYPEVNIVAWSPQDVTLLWMGLAAVGYAVLLLAARRFRDQDLVLYSVAFCALLLLQPYSQKQSALVLLVWPAIVGAARAGSMTNGAKAAFYCAAGLSALQPLLAHSAVQRWLQVIGMDAFIVMLACFALSMTLVRESNAQQ